MAKPARPRKPMRLLPEKYWKDAAFWTGGWATPALIFHAGWKLKNDRQIHLACLYVVAIVVGIGSPFHFFVMTEPPMPMPVRVAALAAVWVLGVVHAGWAAPVLHRRVAAINAVAALQGIEVEMPTVPDAPDAVASAAPALPGAASAASATAFAPAPWETGSPAWGASSRGAVPFRPTTPAVPAPMACSAPPAPRTPSPFGPPGPHTAPTAPGPPGVRLPRGAGAPGPQAVPGLPLPSAAAPPAGPPVPAAFPGLPVPAAPSVPAVTGMPGAPPAPRLATHDWLVFTSGLSPVRPASTMAVAEARARLRRRKKARQILASEPDLALELRIGRPDLPRDYDDGGLIDVNHVPAEVLIRELEIAADDAHRLVEQRQAHGGFSHPEELVYYCDLTPERLTVISGRLVFVPA